jgi:hypothetical protein
MQQIKDLRELYDAEDPDLDDMRVLDDHLSVNQEVMDTQMAPADNQPSPLTIKDEVMSDLDVTLSESEIT